MFVAVGGGVFVGAGVAVAAAGAWVGFDPAAAVAPDVGLAPMTVAPAGDVGLADPACDVAGGSVAPADGAALAELRVGVRCCTFAPAGREPAGSSVLSFEPVNQSTMTSEPASAASGNTPNQRSRFHGKAAACSLPGGPGLGEAGAARRCSSAGTGAAWSMALPHCVQYLRPSPAAAPHCVQKRSPLIRTTRAWCTGHSGSRVDASRLELPPEGIPGRWHFRARLTP